MRTHCWTWKNIYDDDVPFQLTDSHIEDIRTLMSYWETCESGAACLADTEGNALDLEEDDSDESLLAREIFFAFAEVKEWSGEITNPYFKFREGEELIDLLSDAPDQEVVKELYKEKTISFMASEDEINLWKQANLYHYGINSKRPFGSGLVARDVRASVDPDKKITQKAFKKLQFRLESRMILMLQYFIQHAEVERGLYQRVDGGVHWEKIGEEVDHGREKIDLVEWNQRCSSTFNSSTSDYAETMKALSHLVWNNRVTGTYPEHVRRFNLNNSYSLHSEYEGHLEDQLLEGLRAFSAEDHEDSYLDLQIQLLRVYNALGEHENVLTQLCDFGYERLQMEEVKWCTSDCKTLLATEKLIALYGSGKMSFDEFTAVLAGTHQAWKTEKGYIWNVCQQLFFPDDNQTSERLRSGRFYPEIYAACRQLEVMRGGYDPDYEVKWFK